MRMRQLGLRKVCLDRTVARFRATAKHAPDSRKQAMKDVANDKDEQDLARVEEDQHAYRHGKDYGTHAATARADSFET